MSNPTVDEMAMAHLRLSQSLRSMSSGGQAYKDTEAALVSLSNSIGRMADTANLVKDVSWMDDALTKLYADVVNDVNADRFSIMEGLHNIINKFRES